VNDRSLAPCNGSGDRSIDEFSVTQNDVGQAFRGLINVCGADRPAAAAQARAFTVWYDGDCPICTAEIGLMRRLDRASAIEFVDLSSPDVCPTDREARLARLHVQISGGPMVVGAAAFVTLWSALPGLRSLAGPASLPPVLWLLERAYLFFLKLRPTLQAIVRWGLAGQSWGRKR
jgi:predicted DCC family thiol-disulfide oxidoreductase YuxK